MLKDSEFKDLSNEGIKHNRQIHVQTLRKLSGISANHEVIKGY